MVSMVFLNPWAFGAAGARSTRNPWRASFVARLQDRIVDDVADPTGKAPRGEETQQWSWDQEQKQVLRPDDRQGALQQLDRQDRNGEANAVDDRQG
jgi:hypothetical protein